VHGRLVANQRWAAFVAEVCEHWLAWTKGSAVGDLTHRGLESRCNFLNEYEASLLTNHRCRSCSQQAQSVRSGTWLLIDNMTLNGTHQYTQILIQHYAAIGSLREVEHRRTHLRLLKHTVHVRAPHMFFHVSHRCDAAEWAEHQHPSPRGDSDGPHQEGGAEESQNWTLCVAWFKSHGPWAMFV